MKKRVLSMLMALALCLTLLPAPVRAAEDTPEGGAIVQEEQQEKAPAAESPAISEQAVDAVAEVDGTTYTDLIAAFDAAQEKTSATVKLLADVTTNGRTSNTHGDNGVGYYVFDQGNVTFDLNGNTLTWTKYDAYKTSLLVGENGRLTVCDGGTGGKIYNEETQAINIYAGTLTIQSGTLMSESGKALKIDGGVVSITGGTVQDTSYFGEGVWINPDTVNNKTATLTISGDAKLIGGTSGIGLYVDRESDENPVVKISGGTYTGGSNGIECNSTTVGTLLDEGCRYMLGGSEVTDTGVSTLGSGVTVEANPNAPVKYINADGNEARANCTEITAETLDISQGWYVVKENVTISNLNISCEVNLILCDGATLTFADYLNVGQNSTLYLYWQSAGSGKLTAKAIGMMGTVTAPAGGMKQTTGEGGTTFEKCFEHDWEYTNNGDTHTAKCKLCGKNGGAVNHSYTDWTDNSDSTHTGKCVCGVTSTENHALTCTLNDDGLTHSTECSVCGYTAAAESHNFNQTDEYGKKCACGAYLVAEYNGRQYATLASAIEAAKNGGTVTLQAATVRENITIEDGTNVTIDLNGKIWTLDYTNGAVPVLTVTGGSVTVKNGTLMSGSTSYAATAVEVEGGKLTVGEDMTIQGGMDADRQFPAIDVKGGELTLSEGTELVCGMRVPEGKQLKDYLPAGTAFQQTAYDQEDTTETAEIINGYVQEYVGKFTLTVVAHTHSVDENNKCACGFSCTHGGTNGFDENATACPYCNAPAVAETDLNDGEGGRLRRRFANLQTAIDADRDGGATLQLLADVTGDYTIDGTQDTGLDLNGHCIKGTVTVKAATGNNTTTFSNTQNTTTAGIDAVVAYTGAKLAGSDYPAVIGRLTLADTTKWKDILQQPDRLGFMVTNTDGTHTWYTPDDVEGSQLNNVIINYDKAAPDWSGSESGIRIKSIWWNKLLSSVTFGLYKCSSLDVYAKANDSQSGVAEYHYYIDNSGSTTTLTAEELDTKTFTKVDAGKNGTTKLTEITSDNSYVVYAYAVDAAGNRSIYISSDGVVLDNTAPELTNVSVPAKSNETLSDTSATITFTGSEAGTYYYILKENGEPAPTVMSDFAAKTAGDKVDTWTAESGVSTGTLTADEGNTITLTNLKAKTRYILYLAATDAAGNASVAESKGADGDSGVVSVSFTTAKTIPYVKTAPVLSGNYGDTVSAMLEKADKTKASVTAGLSSDVTIKGTWSVASEDADKIPTVGTSEKYTLTFTPTGNDADTYNSVSCEVTPEVSKKPVTIVIDDKLKTYGEANPELTWSLATGAAYPDNVLVADDTEEALGISLSTTAKDNSGVGTYAITGSSDSANYEVSFTGRGSDGKSGILTVKQAANSFTTELSCSDYTYAKDKTPIPNATAKFGTVTYKYATAASDGTAYRAPSDESAYTDAIPVNAGIYAVKAYIAETGNYAGLASDPVVFTINKAAEPTIAGEERSYAYSAGSDDKAISVDIAGKLPTDRGTTAYALTKTYNEQLLSDVAVDQDGNLTYKVNEADKSQVGAATTITVLASMENYEDAVYTMTIKITDKKLVTLKSGNTVSVNGSNALTYGDRLSKLSFSSVTFVDADTNTEVKGTLKWADPDCIPTAGTTQAGWVFKPADSKHYEELTGTAAITVARATPAVVTVPAVAERVYTPAVALADSDMTGGSVTGADGSSLAGTWSFTGTNIIPTVNNKGYQAVFTPDDANNYNTVTRTITVKVTKATPVIAQKPTAGALTYGQKLSDSTLTGGKAAYQTADGTEITGAFAWKNSSIKPTAADSQKTEYDVIFTPSDKDNYNAVDTKLALTVNKAAQAPNMPQAAMAPAHSTKKVGDITLPDGWIWQEADKDTALADGVAVTANALYTGTDKGNYETESVSITITRSECEHKNTEIINKKDATCSVEGYTGDTYCKDCGETLATGTAIEKKPHTVKTSATCVSKAVCSVCGEAFGEVDANNHVHTTVKNQKKATCTQTGYTGDTYCTDCNKLLGMGKELAALGHDYKATVTKQPTTTEEGIRTYTCTRCNSSYTESIAKLLEEQHTHNYTGSITKEATCTEAGVRTYTCSCGDSYTENIPATGHSYVSKVTKAATTTEEGIMTYTCSKCGHSYTQPIAKIKSDDSSKDNGSQNQKPQTGTDNGNQNQKPQPDTDNGKDNGTSIKPYIKDDSGKEGWDVIKPQLEEAKSGDTVTVAMNGTTVVPKDVIDSIKGKDTTLVLDMGNGLSWKIFGKDITDAAGDIDFDVTVGADAGKSIPVDVINNVTGERYSMNLSLAYDGELGFTAILTVNMEPKNSGMYANLFYYNEQTGKLEFVSAGQIDSDGNVELAFTHASDYTIVVEANIMNDNSQADNNADETIPVPKTDDSISKYAWNNTIIIIIGICIILIAFGAVFYVRKKSGSEEE